MQLVTYKYTFLFPDGGIKEFVTTIEKTTLRSKPEQNRDYPDWTILENFKCPHCPINAIENYYCPLAINLVDVIEAFKNSLSSQPIECKIEVPERTYFKKVSLQDGVSSLVGLLMATSSCPIIGKLKPMLRVHLPFSTVEETQYRAISMYLLAQYLIEKKGGTPDWQLTNLLKIYEDIRIMNKNVINRILGHVQKDANLNAIVKLNTFADYVSLTIDDKMMEDLELIFGDYISAI